MSDGSTAPPSAFTLQGVKLGCSEAPEGGAGVTIADTHHSDQGGYP
jgi:hypothetical protein